MIDRILSVGSILIAVLIRTVFLSPALWLGWNYGVTQFFENIKTIEWADAIILLGALQTLSLFTLRPISKEVQVLPVVYSPNLLKDIDGEPESNQKQ